ncbi:putative lipoprotein [Ureaplasma parvum serovar 6 str. ATCC 27818]|uniref:MBA family surface membrane protein n=1 Tax=Ureaplasma parvum TaxID=134821 RepID=UPI000173BF6B|nr:hypothetical protein [Ureaplasma parvum]EDU19488.1 putative lipoprotein [Ureaplasma parvum serovar 6 str. ATCC 27818]
MRLKNKNKYWNLLIASLISIPIISTISACSFSETRYKLKVLDYFLKTENDDYYIAYEFNKLTNEDMQKMPKVIFSTSIINSSNQKIAFYVDIKPIIINNRIYIRLPQRPKPNEKIIINSSQEFVGVQVIQTNKMLTRSINFNFNKEDHLIKVVDQSARFTNIKKTEVEFEIKLLNLNLNDIKDKNIEIELTNKKTNKTFKLHFLKYQFNHLTQQNKKPVLTITANLNADANNQLDDGEYFISKLVLDQKKLEINQSVYKPSGLQLDGSINNQRPTYLLIPSVFSKWTKINVLDTKVIKNDGIPQQLQLSYDHFINPYNFKDNMLSADIELISTKNNKTIILKSLKFNHDKNNIVFDLVNNLELQTLILKNPFFKIKSLTIMNDKQTLPLSIREKQLDLTNKHLSKIIKFTFDDTDPQNMLMKFQLDSDSPIVQNTKKVLLTIKKINTDQQEDIKTFSFDILENKITTGSFYDVKNKYFLLNLNKTLNAKSIGQILENDSNYIITKLTVVNNEASINEIPIEIDDLQNKQFTLKFAEYQSNVIKFNAKNDPELHLNIKHFKQLNLTKINKIKLTLKDGKQIIFNRLNNEFSFQQAGFKLKINQNTFPNYLKQHQYVIKSISLINDDQSVIELLSKHNHEAIFEIPITASLDTWEYDKIHNILKIKMKLDSLSLHQSLNPSDYALNFYNLDTNIINRKFTLSPQTVLSSKVNNSNVIELIYDLDNDENIYGGLEPESTYQISSLMINAKPVIINTSITMVQTNAPASKVEKIVASYDSVTKKTKISLQFSNNWWYNKNADHKLFAIISSLKPKNNKNANWTFSLSRTFSNPEAINSNKDKDFVLDKATKTLTYVINYANIDYKDQNDHESFDWYYDDLVLNKVTIIYNDLTTNDISPFSKDDQNLTIKLPNKINS